ncbi:hypothetical protein XALC_2968 [Xanthomonas albilineans GPE PC73]|uniref:Uncharacterized protein n=1 Tax=Xanthomonas albilineans (strain GPE PC73 / CFBP 7063) TaxID=380358 RepID=D2UGD4_XANAP|nr:hypothetical protein XALC_2968 [Xanthomonas albilineans GPE PC73]
MRDDAINSRLQIAAQFALSEPITDWRHTKSIVVTLLILNPWTNKTDVRKFTTSFSETLNYYLAGNFQ